MDDYEAIRQLTYRMAWFADDPEMVPDVMTLWAEDDSIFFDMTGAGGPRVEGRETLSDFLEQVAKGANPLKGSSGQRGSERIHLVSNHIINLDGDSANGRCAMLGHYRMADGATGHSALCYLDEYVRAADGWRFKSRTFKTLVAPPWQAPGKE